MVGFAADITCWLVAFATSKAAAWSSSGALSRRMRTARVSLVEADLRFLRSLQAVIGDTNYRGIEFCFIRVEELNNTAVPRRVQQLQDIGARWKNDRWSTGNLHRLIDGDRRFLIEKLASRRRHTESQQHHSEAILPFAVEVVNRPFLRAIGR